MPVNKEACLQLKNELGLKHITLVAVSKTKPVEDIQALYDLGQRDFGENYVQELAEKARVLPNDIRWHFIGHLQTNKVKVIVPFVQLIHGVDSLKLLKEISKEAVKAGRVVQCLLQVHIAQEETKFGLNENELETVLDASHELPGIEICGLMGMASFSNDVTLVRGEFRQLKQIAERLQKRPGTPGAPWILSMGMSGDYQLAIEEGSTMVRIGSLLFGERDKK